jgi:hypothetical protein
VVALAHVCSLHHSIYSSLVLLPLPVTAQIDVLVVGAGALICWAGVLELCVLCQSMRSAITPKC